MQVDAGSNLLDTWIARAAAAAPDKPWVVSADDGRTVTYLQLHNTVARFAAFLREHGLGPNDRVALLANNSVEQLLCYLGVMAAGATVCISNRQTWSPTSVRVTMPTRARSRSTRTDVGDHV